MSTPLPPIYRDIRRLLVHTEEMVRRFSRYHTYTVGTDLRTQAMFMMRGVNRACFDAAVSIPPNGRLDADCLPLVQQAPHINTLVWLVDEYKLTLQLAMEVYRMLCRRLVQCERNADSLSRRRERVRVRDAEHEQNLLQRTDPHPQPFSRLREKGAGASLLA